MAIEAELADGRILEFPDGTDPSVIQATVKKVLAVSPTFMEGLKGAAARGLEAVPESMAGVGLGIKSALGMASAGEQAAAIREEAKKPQVPGTSWESIEQAYEKEGLLSALKKAPSFVGEKILESAPSMAVPLAAGAAAGAVSGPFAPIVAPLAGIGTYGVQQFGQFMRRQAEEGATADTLDPGKAAVASAVSAPLGYFADRFTLGLSKVPTKVIGDEIAAELAKRTSGVAGRAVKGATLGIVAEAPTEVLEQAAERWQAGLSLTDEEAKREYKEAAAGAVAIGGVGGAASRVLQGAPKAEAPPEAPPEKPLLLGNKPDPLISFPDGTVARQSEVDAYIESLPEDQRPAIRAKLMGLAPQPAKPEAYKPVPSLTGTDAATLLEEQAKGTAGTDLLAGAREREPNLYQPAPSVTGGDMASMMQGAPTAGTDLVSASRERQAEQDRIQQEQQAQAQKQQVEAQERSRQMPGMIGTDTTGTQLVQLQRENQKLKEAATEKAKEIEYRKILATTYSTDPLQNFRQQQAAIDRLDYTTPEVKAQEPAMTEQLLALSREDEKTAPEQKRSETFMIAPPTEGAPVTEPVVTETKPDNTLAGQPTYTEGSVAEVPVQSLKLSTDIPQFKEGADQKGVTQEAKLEGKFDRRLASPIQVWQRANGDMEVISGRHRLDLAQRSGEKTIPAQIHKESDGFTADMARMLDIELNVKDGRGKVKDYVNFFKEFGLTKDQAKADGLLNTAIGRQAYTIADAGSPSLIAAHNNKDISDEAATSIAINAPKDEALQNLGMNQVIGGKSINHAVNFMRSAMAAGFKGQEGNGDLFGFDDSFAKEAEAVTKEATRQQREARQQLSAIKGAAKSPEKARLGGVDVKNLEATQAKIAELENTVNELENFHTNPELYKKLRQDAGLEQGLTAPVVEEETTPSEEAKDIEDKTIRDKLKRVAKNLGVLVFETSDSYSSGNGVVNIPTEDKQVEGAQTPEHVFAHELGHAILQNRQISFRGMPNAEVEKQVSGWNLIKGISKAFRPEVHNHKLPKFKRHANKPDEIIADALGSFLLGISSRQDIQPIITALNLNDFDLGLKERTTQGLTAPTPESLKAADDRTKAEEKRIADEKKAADEKATADKDVGEFGLTGSDRPADANPDQESMFSLRGKSEGQITAFEQSLRTLLNKFGLKEIGLKLSEGMRDEGSYAAKLIQIAADSANPIRTLRHESVHALRELGFFTDAQWKSLSKMAKDKWIDQYLKQRNIDGKPLKAGEESRYDAYMREYKGDMEKITEEAVADAFADFDTKPPAGMIQAIIQRLRNLFQSIRSALTKMESAEQIFGKVEKGALKVGTERVETESKSLRTTAAGAKEKAQELLQKRKPINKEALSDVDPDYVERLGRVFNPESKTIIDKIEGLKDGFWRRTAQGLADQYRTIKDYDMRSYMLARMSKTQDGGLEGLMFNGHIFNDDGALNIKKNTKGLMESLKPVGNETDRYMMWIALNRESNLPEGKRSPGISSLVEGKDQLSQGTLNGKSRLEVYQGVQKDMNALNKSVLDLALNAGLINSSKREIAELESRDMDEKKKAARIKYLQENPGAYERFTSDLFYIPFYKAMEDGDIQSAVSSAGLTNQKFSAELKGMSDKPFADLMENTLRNWSHILSASMKNQAAASTVEATMEAGATIPNMKPGLAYRDGQVISTKNDEVVGDGKLRPEYTEPGKGMVKTMKDGQPMYFEVLDPMLLDSITSIGYMGPKSKFLDVARDFKNMLQYGVTISPTFKVNNLIRDSISAMAVSDLKKSPVANVVEGMSLANKDSPTYIEALAGGAIFNFGSTYEGDQAKSVKRLLKQGVKAEHILDTKEKIEAGLKGLWDKYQELGNKTEAANRLALYKQMRDKGMSHLEAAFQARDLMDFSMQGSWPAFRTVTMVVPFLNARVQGLYKLGRDGIVPTGRVMYNTITGKELWETDANGKLTQKGLSDKNIEQKKAYSFSIVTTAVSLASMALYMAFKDDEDFKKRDEWDRDNFWWIKLPNMDYALRVPKPFEIGAFGTMSERILEQIIDQGAEGKTFGNSLSRMLFDTFAMNPTPQMFKPLLDLYANKDSFTGAPIESAGMERLSKQERMTDNTSPLAQALGGMTSILGEKGQLSPVQADYAIKAYFGWLGATASATSMYAVMPFKEGAYPDTNWMDKASLGLVRTLPSNQSKYTTAFYDANKEISQAFADMRHYADIGDSEKVQQLLEEKGDKIRLSKLYDKTAKSMANVRKQIRIVMNDDTLDGATKQEEINRMKQIISMYAEQAESVRKSLK